MLTLRQIDGLFRINTQENRDILQVLLRVRLEFFKKKNTDIRCAQQPHGHFYILTIGKNILQASELLLLRIQPFIKGDVRAGQLLLIAPQVLQIHRWQPGDRVSEADQYLTDSAHGYEALDGRFEGCHSLLAQTLP